MLYAALAYAVLARWRAVNRCGNMHLSGKESMVYDQKARSPAVSRKGEEA